ncbi:hypothetical protein IKG07_01380 [Candidatus Saccharibacteria bacterium]|nr:hypothetical protein [Candidatus Saccharibacteria bacterium]
MAENKTSLEEKHCYYGVLLGFLYAVGNNQAYIKMGINDEEGVYPVQKMMYDYGISGRIDEEIRISSSIQDITLKNLNKWSKRVGFKPIRDTDLPKIVKFCQDETRRSYIRNRVQKCFRTGELLSIADLIQLRLDVEKKAIEKAKKTRRGC